MPYVLPLLVAAVLVASGIYALGGSQNAHAAAAPAGACHVVRSQQSALLAGNCTGGLPKYVASFDGYSSNASYIFSQTNMTINKSFTVSFWMMPYRVGNGLRGSRYSEDLVDVYNNTGEFPQMYTEWRGNGMFNLNICGEKSANSTENCTESFAVENWTDKWVYIDEEYDNGSFAVYANGVPIFSSANTVNSSAHNYSWSQAVKNIRISKSKVYISLFVAFAPNTMDSEFDGDMSNVQIYTKMLSGSQVKRLYNGGIGAVPIDPAHLAGWWPLNGNANDYSGNGYNGVLNGRTSFTALAGWPVAQ